MRENLLLAAPSATDERLGKVLQLVGLTNLLESEGLYAWLGDGGRQLSGGEQRRQGKTLILVTHRLYGLEQFDRICVIDNGQVVEQGTPAALMDQQGHYTRFHQRINVTP